MLKISTINSAVEGNRNLVIHAVVLLLSWLLLSNAFLWIYTGEGVYVLDPDTEAGARYYSLFRYLVFFLMFAYVARSLSVKPFKFEGFRLIFPLVIVVLYIGLSMFWSLSSFTAYRVFILLMFQILIGGYLAVIILSGRGVQVITMASVLFVFVNLFFIVAFPHLGYDKGGFGGVYQGAMKGIFASKNVFGANLSIAVAILAHKAFGISGLRLHPIEFVAMAIALTMLFLSESVTSIGSFLSVVSGIISLHLIKKIFDRDNFKRSISKILLLILIFTLTVFVILAVDVIQEVVGRDLTLTGRTEIWLYTIEMAFSHFFFGYGVSGFWYVHPDSFALLDRLGYLIGQSHNGYIELFLHFGFVGFLISLYFLIWCVFLTFRLMKASPFRSESSMLLVIMLLLLVQNFSESILFYPVRVGLAFFSCAVFLSCVKSSEGTSR